MPLPVWVDPKNGVPAALLIIVTVRLIILYIFLGPVSRIVKYESFVIYDS